MKIQSVKWTGILSIITMLALTFSTLGVTPAHAAGIRYSKSSATGDCSSWANACTLQTALTGAASGDEIWAAAGTHKPTTGTDRNATFQLKGGVALYGGFAGTETARDQRNPTTNLTILSGDIDNNDNQRPVITDLTTVTGNTANSYRVVTGATNATLDGFTITAGYANGASLYNFGGGMYNDASSPALANLTFSGNSARYDGGGMFNYSSSSPILTDVIFSDNLADGQGGGMYNGGNSSPSLTNVTFSGNSADAGGAMSNRSSSPVLTNVTFSGNSVGWDGGGMYNYSSSPTLMDVTFSGNSATGNGGGMYNDSSIRSHSDFSSHPTLTNVTFSDNSATGNGGGMVNYCIYIPDGDITDFSRNSAAAEGGVINYPACTPPTLTNVTFSSNSAGAEGGGMDNYSSSPMLTNVTFSGNSAFRGGGMDNKGVNSTVGIAPSNPQIRNTIFWGNTASSSGAQIYNSNSTPSVSDSVVQGGYAGGTNIITTNPMLGTLGNHGGFTQTIPLLAGSSAIDTGNGIICPATDQRGVSRPIGGGCDIGAFEYDPVPQMIVSSSSPTDGAVVVTETNSLKVVFNKDMLHDGSANAANNPVNYLLVEDGANGTFDTLTCKGGVLTDDTQVTVNSISYNASSYTATLAVNGGAALPNGSYRLIVCGTTSITDLFGLKLNYGLSDTAISFRVNIATGTGTSTGNASSKAITLPATGFAPNRANSLPIQPAEKAYTTYGELTLEIPALGMKTAIVGVPQTTDGWDVTWLGNSAGWLNGTAFPTWNGNSVITGHIWDANNNPGIFVNLKKLKYGDRVKIHAWGEVYTYEVRENRVISPSSLNAVLKHEDMAWVTLLTCEDFNRLFAKYTSRRLVRAVLLSVTAE